MPESFVAVSEPQPRHLWKGLESALLTTGAQTAIQVLGFLGGLIVLRWLPVREYAYYTIANAALGTMTVLTDSGISQSVMAQGGKVWQSRAALGGVVGGGMALRRRFALVAASVSMPILYLLLRRQGALPTAAILVAVSILPLFLSSLTGQLLQIVPRLHQRVLPLQGILISAAALRLVLVAGAAALFPLAWLVSLCAGAAQSWANWRTRRLAGALADLDASPDPTARAAMVRQVRRSAANAIYYAFEGQITVWLISIFGKTQAIAQVGALNRLAMLYSIVSAVFSVLLVPRFARMQADQTVLRRFWLIQLALLLFLIMTVAGVALFPKVALSVLGREYASLTHEIVLTAAGGALALLSGCAYWLAASRGVVLTPWFIVPFALSFQLLLIVTLPMSSVAGVLWLGILTNVAYWGAHALNFTRTVLKQR